MLGSNLRLAFLSLAVAGGCARSATQTEAPSAQTPPREVPVAATPARPGGGIEDGSSVTAPRPPVGPPGVPVSPEPTTTGPGAAAPMPTEAELGEPLDDEKILEVAHVISSSAIDEGDLARANAADPAVRRFAVDLADEGRVITERGERIARAARLLPRSSRLSDRLKHDQGAELAALAQTRGAGFDQGFVDRQVDRQRALVRLIDHRLLPNATRPPVKALLNELRPQAERRYEQARALKDKLD